MTIYEEIAALEQKRRRGVLVTVISAAGTAPRKAGAKMLVRSDGSVSGSVGGGSMEKEAVATAMEALVFGEPCLRTFDAQKTDINACGGRITLFFDPFGAGPDLLIVGNGHVGSALAHLARFSGYPVRVLDDRMPLHRDGESDPGFILLQAYHDPFDGVPVTKTTAIVISTRSHDFDLQVLRAALQSGAGFIGLLGSKKKKKVFFDTLRKERVAEEALQRVRTPVGLDIAAETPAEIAVSIMAQLIRENRRR